MKNINRIQLIEFELASMDLADALEVKDKDNLEWLSATLHEHLEMAMSDYAMDYNIEEYEPQY